MNRVAVFRSGVDVSEAEASGDAAGIRYFREATGHLASNELSVIEQGAPQTNIGAAYRVVPGRVIAEWPTV